MNKKEILLTVLSVSVLSACASRNHEPPTRAERLSSIKAQHETVAEERKGAATVAYGWTRFAASGKTEMPAKHLRIIHPSHSTQVVALKTLGLLLGGSYQGSDKKDLKGDVLPNVPNRSLSAAYRPVRDYVLGKYGGEDGAAYFPLYVGGRHWFLVYEKFADGRGGKYELVSEIEFVKPNEIYGTFNYVCKQGGVAKTLNEWEADNYRLAHETAARYAKQCADALLADTVKMRQLHHSFERE